MNASTATRPAPAASQKPREGCSPARSTAKTAVQAGSSAITTAPWEESTWRSASAVEQREADDDAERDDRQRAPLLAARPRRAPGAQQDHREDGADRGAAERDEHRVEVGDREPGGGSENENSATPSVASASPRSSSRRADAAIVARRDNVTRSFHDLE